MKKYASWLANFVRVVLCWCIATSATGEEATLWPGAKYDVAVPSVQSVLGYAPGQHISSYDEMMRYLQALAAAVPERVKLVQYATSWEGRKLIYLAIGNAQRIAELETFARDMHTLANAKTSKATADNLIQTLPSSVWLGYSVHGNEISSTDAAMATAYHLLAAEDDPIVAEIFNNSIVFIDPLQNPDGRSRFTSRYYATVGSEHSGDRLSAEQNEPWPNGRSNHYLFDLNRDWLTVTQPETLGKVRAMSKFLPLVVIDLHEMGGDSSYFFAPPANPINPDLTATQLENLQVIGRNNAKHFDRLGFAYYTREVFDAFYPGYGDSWPTYYGAVASTYEVASARGEKFLKANGDTLSFRDTVQQHFVASIATAEATAKNREKLLRDFRQYQLTAVSEGEKDRKTRSFIFSNSENKAGTARLAALLALNGLEVQQSEEEFSACGNRYPAGAMIVDRAQPRGRFANTVLSQQVDMSAAFIKEQERLRARKLPATIYDVTAWSLPLMFDVPMDTCGRAIDVKHKVIAADYRLPGKLTGAPASVAYLVPWADLSSGRFLVEGLKQSLTIKSASKAFTMEGLPRFPAGSLIIEVKNNAADVHEKIKELVTMTGTEVIGVDTSWVVDGPSFGSDEVLQFKAPNIALAWDEPSSSLSAGNSRFVIERQLGYPVTAIRNSTLKDADLSDYHVLIMPAGEYEGFYSEETAARMRQWVERGGVLITLGEATRFAAQKKFGLLTASLEYAYSDSAAESTATPADGEEEINQVAGTLIDNKNAFLKAIENDDDKPDYVAGVLANITVDQEHWLTAGISEQLAVLVNGSDIYAPVKLASGSNLAWYSGEESVLASGYLWQENKKQMAFKPFLIQQPMGKGMVIGFTQDPTARAYLDGLNLLLANALFRSVAYASGGEYH